MYKYKIEKLDSTNLQELAELLTSESLDGWEYVESDRDDWGFTVKFRQELSDDDAATLRKEISEKLEKSLAQRAFDHMLQSVIRECTEARQKGSPCVSFPFGYSNSKFDLETIKKVEQGLQSSPFQTCIVYDNFESTSGRLIVRTDKGENVFKIILGLDKINYKIKRRCKNLLFFKCILK